MTPGTLVRIVRGAAAGRIGTVEGWDVEFEGWDVEWIDIPSGSVCVLIRDAQLSDRLRVVTVVPIVDLEPVDLRRAS